jgi:hypothetical protein
VDNAKQLQLITSVQIQTFLHFDYLNLGLANLPYLELEVPLACQEVSFLMFSSENFTAINSLEASVEATTALYFNYERSSSKSDLLTQPSLLHLQDESSNKSTFAA